MRSGSDTARWLTANAAGIGPGMNGYEFIAVRSLGERKHLEKSRSYFDVFISVCTIVDLSIIYMLFTRILAAIIYSNYND